MVVRIRKARVDREVNCGAPKKVGAAESVLGGPYLKAFQLVRSSG
jgi:hypothetical protein